MPGKCQQVPTGGSPALIPSQAQAVVQSDFKKKNLKSKRPLEEWACRLANEWSIAGNLCFSSFK